jgi:hypothetical protein
MTTNVPFKDVIKGVWHPVSIESGLYTAQPAQYLILWFPELKQYAFVEETGIGEEENLSQLYLEFAEEDMQLAEAGLSEYNDILINEDKG